jgi:predicted AAA+ superfamily ATPase
VKYYINKNGSEVDFIVDDKIPIEIKSNISGLKVSKSYRYFLENYQSNSGYILNFNKIGEISINNSKIKFLPHFFADKLLL